MEEIYLKKASGLTKRIIALLCQAYWQWNDFGDCIGNRGTGPGEYSQGRGGNHNLYGYS